MPTKTQDPSPTPHPTSTPAPTGRRSNGSSDPQEGFVAPGAVAASAARAAAARAAAAAAAEVAAGEVAGGAAAGGAAAGGGGVLATVLAPEVVIPSVIIAGGAYGLYKLLTPVEGDPNAVYTGPIPHPEPGPPVPQPHSTQSAPPEHTYVAPPELPQHTEHPLNLSPGRSEVTTRAPAGEVQHQSPPEVSPAQGGSHVDTQVRRQTPQQHHYSAPAAAPSGIQQQDPQVSDKQQKRAKKAAPPVIAPPPPERAPLDHPEGRSVPQQTEFFQGLRRLDRNTWTDGKFKYQWDGMHGEWEKFDKTGKKHLGVVNPDGSDRGKATHKGRTVRNDAGSPVELKDRNPPVSAGQAPAEGSKPHPVQPGESLSAIAQQVWGHPEWWPLIQRANNDVLQGSTVIHPGQQLTIPALGAQETAPKAAPEGAPAKAPGQGGHQQSAPSPGTIEVQPHDTLAGIAARELHSKLFAGAIYELNKDVIGSNPESIKPGQILQMPANPQVVGFSKTLEATLQAEGAQKKGLEAGKSGGQQAGGQQAAAEGKAASAGTQAEGAAAPAVPTNNRELLGWLRGQGGNVEGVYPGHTGAGGSDVEIRVKDEASAAFVKELLAKAEHGRPLKVAIFYKSGNKFTDATKHQYSPTAKPLPKVTTKDFTDALGATQGATKINQQPGTHVVQPHEWLSTIARDRLGDMNRWPEILELNHALLQGDAHNLKPGMTIKLPTGKAPSAESATASEARLLDAHHADLKKLGLPTDKLPTAAEVKKQMRKLVRELHPDVASGQHKSAEKVAQDEATFKEVGQALQNLKDAGLA